jgi:penicillin amidase
VLNPEQGFIVTANNPQVRAEDFPYLIAIWQDQGQRAGRITDMITANAGPINLEDLISIQTDTGSLSALEVIPYLQGLTIDDPEVAAARDKLLRWGGQMHKDSPEAALYNLFWVRLIANTYNDELLPDYHPDGKDGTADSMYRLLQDPESAWWDDARTADVVETRDAVLLRSLSEALAGGRERLGENLDDWRWGDLHLITFRNDTLGNSGIGFIENIFNRGPYPTSGSESVPQKTCWDANNGFEVTCIPALRQIIDLSDLGNSLMIHSVGQSGHPMSDQYDNFIELWRNFEYHPSNWSREAAESGRHQLLTLQPAEN